MYTDRKGYQCLMGSKIQERLEIDHSRAFSILWRIQVPMKIKAFSWSLFLNRCATKDSTEKRGLYHSINEGTCLFCLQSEEDLIHLSLIV